MSVSREETLRQFCDVTGADETRSRFFLESSNWQLEVALSSFYEHGGNLDEVPVSSAATAIVPTLSDSDMESPPASPPQQQKKDKKKKSGNTKFATLDSLHQDSSSDEEEVSMSGWIANKMKMVVQEFFCEPASCSKRIVYTTTGNSPARDISSPSLESKLRNKEEEIIRLKSEVERLLSENCELRKELVNVKGIDTDVSEGQAFYAGGSDRSGQQILGPGKNRNDIVSEMFKSVRERGGVVFENEPSTASRGRGGGAFSGAGYRLGQTTDDHEQVTPGNASAQSQEQVRTVQLRLYRDGFTVDAGPLRPYGDPDNAQFLSCIRRGEIPAELSRVVGGAEVRVSLEDRRLEPAPAPAPAAARAHAFAGKGHMLGSPTPATVGAPTLAGAPAAAAADREANQRAAQAAVGLDPAAPVAPVQFRLADGTRLTGRFNPTHTVADLAAFVARAEPAYQLRPFALLTAFPSAELADPAATVGGARLANTTLLQRLK